ncbi:MAG: glycosyltransferase family 2 protein [Clostridiales bacterium]|nr:glycosyltransferase family 2 protein [Clostridiales bacterium]
MLVTIIVPVYNTQKDLPRCLDSLISQSYEKLDIILIDDGSTDNSGSICDEYAHNDQRIRVIHKRNGGVSAARNSGLDLARGEYLIFVDSDDCIHRHMISIYVQALAENVVLACDYTKQEDELELSYDKIWSTRIQYYHREEFLQFMKDEYVNAPWNKFYDTKILREHQIRFDETKKLGEDFLFNLEYFQFAPAKYKVIHCPLYYYQEGREDSLANAFAPQLFDLQVELFERLRMFMEKCRIWTMDDQRSYYELYWNRLYLVFRIFLAYKKDKANTNEAENVLLKALGNTAWKEAWSNYVDRGAVSVKDRIKHWHVQLLYRKYL